MSDVELWRQGRLDPRQRRFHPADNIEGGRARAFQNRKQCRAHSILRNDVRLHGKAVSNVRDIANVNHRVVYLSDRQIVQRLQKFRTRVQPHIVFAVADFLRPGRKDDVLGIERVADVCWGKSFAEKFLRIEIDHDLARLAAVWQRDLCALHGGELRADEIQTKIVELLLREGFTR